MKNSLFWFLILLLGILHQECTAQLSEEKILEKAQKIHTEVLTIDTHNDTPMRFRNRDFNMAERHDFQKDGSRVDFARMKEGGLDGAFFAVFIGQGPLTAEARQEAYQRAVETLRSVLSAAEIHNTICGIAKTPKDAYELEKEGKRIIFIGMENGYPIGLDINRIEEFHKQGVRYITLCHSSNNDICDSSTDRSGALHHGLSDFGNEVVKEMNRLGIMVDVSHMSDESFFDVINVSQAPIIASHSSARALCNSPRNLSDEMLKALAENGGVVQICILSSYIKDPEPNPERDSAMSAIRAKYADFDKLKDDERREMRNQMNTVRQKYPTSLATVKDAVDHIDHVVQVAGIDHVGIGTDFDGGGGLADCQDVSQMGNITIELVRRGYSINEIEKIWGGNVMRVLKQVETIAEASSIN